jgi:hypothetical protein
MTDVNTDIITSGKPNQGKDPNALKIASFRTKEGVWAEFCQKAESIGLTATDVLKAAMEQFIAGEYSPTMGKLLVHHDSRTDGILTKDEVNTAVMTRIDEAIDKQIKPLVDRTVADELLRVKADNVTDVTVLEELVKVNIEPLADLLAELETYTQSQFAAVREELKKAASYRAVEIPVAIAETKAKPVSDNPNRKTWAGFFEMVGIKALTATEAQRKENNDIRAKQIEQGVQAAREQGFGEWLPGKEGRDFVRVEASNLDTPPLFPE